MIKLPAGMGANAIPSRFCKIPEALTDSVTDTGTGFVALMGSNAATLVGTGGANATRAGVAILAELSAFGGGTGVADLVGSAFGVGMGVKAGKRLGAGMGATDTGMGTGPTFGAIAFSRFLANGAKWPFGYSSR
jgi:hypothetical protein